jgi:hypothetical protein
LISSGRKSFEMHQSSSSSLIVQNFIEWKNGETKSNRDMGREGKIAWGS